MYMGPSPRKVIFFGYGVDLAKYFLSSLNIEICFFVVVAVVLFNIYKQNMYQSFSNSFDSKRLFQNIFESFGTIKIWDIATVHSGLENDLS